MSDAMPVPAADVEATRTRARRRLIGMAVLVGAGLIGFPWLFETQPRPMSGDVQIVQGGPGADGDVQISGTVAARSGRSVAGRVAVSGIVAPAEQDEPATSAGDAAQAAKPVQDAPAHKVADKGAEKAVDKAAGKGADKPPAKPADKPSAKPAAKDAAKDAPKPQQAKPEKAPEKSPEKAAEKPADKDKTPVRYVVQFGAFADANTAHEARMKVERLGLKTYTQQVDTPAGKRIRVRMGPYADKAEADKAMATLRKASLSGAVLTL